MIDASYWNQTHKIVVPLDFTVESHAHFCKANVVYPIRGLRVQTQKIFPYLFLFLHVDGVWCLFQNRLQVLVHKNIMICHSTVESNCARIYQDLAIDLCVGYFPLSIQIVYFKAELTALVSYQLCRIKGKQNNRVRKGQSMPAV